MWLKNKFNCLKLNQKFNIVIGILVLTPLMIFSIVFFQGIREDTIDKARQESAYYVAENCNILRKVVEMCNMSTQAFLNAKDLSDFLERLKAGENISTKTYMDFMDNNIASMERLVNSNPYLYRISVYAFNNDFPEMVPILYHWNRAENQPWYENYKSGRWQFDFQDNLYAQSKMNKSEHLMALVSDMTNSDGEVIGVVETAVSMEEFMKDLYNAGDDVWACFLKDDGTVYGDTAKQWQGKKDKILENAKNIEYDTSGHIRIDGEDIVLTVHEIKELEGTYIRAVSLKKTLSVINSQRNMLMIIFLAGFLVVFVIINLLVKSLLKKFYEILMTVHSVSEGDMDVRVKVDMRDEIGELGTQINRMLDVIQKLVREQVDREVLVKNTEIKALQNQINAHFIYNVLESVKMMAEIDEKYEISDAVTALGELLRYSMKWVSGTVEIGQEMQYIRNYIQLMNLRYDFTIQLSVSIPDFVYHQKIPKMSLQPIVENALVHGFEEIGEDAVIYIKASDRGDDYVIEITDSGIGMSDEQLEIVKKRIRGEIEVSGGSGNGIGLKNVQDRIKMQFGDKYGMQFYSKEGCYTKVSILLPKTVEVNYETSVNCRR